MGERSGAHASRITDYASRSHPLTWPAGEELLLVAPAVENGGALRLVTRPKLPPGWRVSPIVLEIYEGSSARFCDGITRRNVLKAGVLAPLGLALTDLLRLQAA